MASADGYNQYTQNHSYHHEPGTRIAPSSNRTGAARMLRVCGEYGTRVVDFRASRSGNPPILPAAEDTYGDTYAGGTVSLPLPTVDNRTGGFIFSGSGRYRFLQNSPRVPGTDPLPTGAYPWSVTSDVIAYTTMRNDPGWAAAIADPVDPEAAVLTLAGANYFDDDNPGFGWYLTGFPSEAFSINTISG